MKFEIHYIGSRLQEMKVDEIETSTLNPKEATELAVDMIAAALELLRNLE